MDTTNGTTIPAKGNAPSGADLAHVAMVIPAWQPGPPLVSLVDALLAQGMPAVIVVNDGSAPACAPIFDRLASLPEVTVLAHTTNQGKGRALKTAFQYILQHRPNLHAVVTADADGQHLPADIVRVAQRLSDTGDTQNTVVLGSRRFDRNVPWKSLVGNWCARNIFAFVTGTLLQDTQTGLRGLPKALLPDLLQVPGERYEYETAMLVRLCQESRPLIELPITTVYLDGNRGSHFHPIWDSLKVYGALWRVFRSHTHRGRDRKRLSSARPRTA